MVFTQGKITDVLPLKFGSAPSKPRRKDSWHKEKNHLLLIILHAWTYQCKQKGE